MNRIKGKPRARKAPKVAAASAASSNGNHVGRPVQHLFTEGGRYTRFGYESVRKSRRDGVLTQSGAGDFDDRVDRPTLIKLSRKFYKDNPIYRGMINRYVSAAIQDGFNLQPRTGNRAVNARLERAWREYAKDPETRGQYDWKQCERVALREQKIAGDMGAIKIGRGPHAGRIQLIESEQIENSSNRLGTGIDADRQGRPMRYHVRSYSPSGHQISGESRTIDAKDFIFVANPERISSTRGIPPAQSAFAMLNRIDDVCNSEALAWQILSRIAIAITRDNASRLGYESSAADTEVSDPDGNDISTRIHEFPWGLVFHGNKGEKVEGVDRNIPGQNFSESLVTFLRLLGLPLGMPIELILLDWSRTNMSSARIALVEFWETLVIDQEHLVRRFHAPVYEWKVEEWIRNDIVPRRPDIFDHAWIPPKFPWADPQKEVAAEGAKLDRMMTTLQRSCKSHNVDLEELYTERGIEFGRAWEKALELETSTGGRIKAEDVWHHLAGLSKKTTSLAVTQANGGAADTPGPGTGAGSDETQGGNDDDGNAD